MNKRISISKYLIALTALLGVGLSAYAQASYYDCDFETAAKRQAWHLNTGNKGANCQNKWYIGEPGDLSEYGQFGLFISSQNTETPDAAEYKATVDPESAVAAYTDITLAPGSYCLDFDWRCGGTVNSYFAVFFVPNTQNIISNPNGGYNTAALNPYRLGTFFNGSTWTSAHIPFTVTSATSAGRLVFIFRSQLNEQNNPAPCIDNIAIYENCHCTAPTNVVYTSSRATLAWKRVNTAQYYQVRDYCSYDGVVQYYDSVMTNSCVINATTEGYHYISVRSCCGDSCYSEWVTIGEFVFIPGARCIDFMDLGDKNHAGVCYSGSTDDPKANLGQVDDGTNSQYCLHAVQYIPNQYDARTGYGLRTIPEGEVASVRLGGLWDNSTNKAECIEYDYTVQAGQSDILILKYAAVLCYAEYHSESEEARFQLDVLDKATGRPLGTCTSADFRAGFGDVDTWHHSMYNGDRFDWCDWTTVSVSLRNYIGRTLTIRLTSYSCAQTIHPGYAYFTIGCQSGDLQGIACGDFETDHFEGPDGFYYEWALADNPTQILGTDQIFNIDKTDDRIYILNVIPKTGRQCGYTLTANPNPRFPVVDVDTVSVVSADCANIVTFSNASHISIINRKDGSQTETQDPVEDLIWDFGDGYPIVHSTTKVMTHEYPNTGGTFTCKVYASMTNGRCVDSTMFVITLPDLVHTGDTLRSDHPIRKPYTGISGKVWNSEVDTMYVDSIMRPNQYGCQAPFYEYIYFHSAIRDTLHHMMCEGDSILFEVGDTIVGYTTKVFRTSTLDSAIYRTAEMADSLRYLDLYVVPRVEISCDTALWICGDDNNLPIDIRAVAGERQVDSIYIYTDERAQKEGRAPLYQFAYGDDVVLPLDSIKEDGKHYYMRPDDYELKLHIVVTYDTVGAPLCPVEDHDISLHISYASFIMYQKHGFIGLYNSSNNQYNFDYVNKFTWYCNDELMPNDTLAYIRVKDSDWGKQYRVEVTRLDDGKTMISCPLTYTYGMPEGMDDMSADESVVAYFDLLGRRYATLPEKTGVYVVVFTNHSKKIVVH